MTVTAPQVENHGHPHEVEIEVNYRRIRVPRDTTGAQIKAAANLPVDYELFRIHGEDEIRIGDEEEITVHTGEKFVAAPGLEPA